MIKLASPLSHLSRYILSRTMSSAAIGPVTKTIQSKISSEASPVHLQVINESYMHNVPKGAETHFKVVVVSKIFDGMTLLKRHQMINTILKYELENGVHALSIMAETPEEWDKSGKTVDPSPHCRGGFGK